MSLLRGLVRFSRRYIGIHGFLAVSREYTGVMIPVGDHGKELQVDRL